MTSAMRWGETQAEWSAPGFAARLPGVSMMLGSTTLHRTPSAVASTAIAWEKAMTAALAVMYPAAPAAIVCVSSRAAVKPFAGAAGYITAKAAVIAFAQAVAAESTADGVRCNVVLPSIIDTPGNRAANPGADRSAWVSPQRIAEVIRFLCDSGSEPMSGAALPVYGPA